jgi:hypothetical protein
MFHSCLHQTDEALTKFPNIGAANLLCILSSLITFREDFMKLLLFLISSIIGLLVALSLVPAGTFAAKPQTRRYVNIPRPGAVSNLPFSDGVMVGDTLYLAGPNRY